MRESRLFIILISLVMGLAGCSKETMIGEYVDRCAVRLDIDWGPCGIDPDGMTALFYPVDQCCDDFFPGHILVMENARTGMAALSGIRETAM